MRSHEKKSNRGGSAIDRGHEASWSDQGDQEPHLLASASMSAPWYQQKRQKKQTQPEPPEPLDANSSSDTELQADDSDEGAAASLILLLDLPKQEASGSKGAPFNPRVPSRRPAARKGERWQACSLAPSALATPAHPFTDRCYDFLR